MIAGIVASVVMVVLSSNFGGLSLPESFGSEITALMPASTFVSLHEMIGGDAKYYLFYIIFAGQCLVFAVAGGLYNVWRNQKNLPMSWMQGLVLALILWLATGLLLLPLTRSGIFGANLTVGLGSGIVSLAIVGLVFGLIFVFCQRFLLSRALEHSALIRNRPEDEFSERLSRRRMLIRGGVIAGVVVAGVGVWHFITQGVAGTAGSIGQVVQNYRSKITPPPVPNYGNVVPTRFLSPEVTPTDQYYIVSKNLYSDPNVREQGWSLAVNGQVEHPYSLSYGELLTMPMQTQYESMMCISNEVGGSYMSNALWKGVRLSDLLQRAGVKTGATKIVLHADDDYADSIHLSKALETTTLLALNMNGQTIPSSHGFPARMLVPGIYGMKHVKWLTRIEVVNYDFQGYWQERGWDDAAPIRLTSRIDTPLDGIGVSANKPTYIAGVAFSGNKGISEVDVSLDGGKAWQRATLKKPLSSLTWVLWELSWQPASGSYTIMVRAVDLEGNVQDPNQEPPAPIGSSGYHTITVDAV